MISRITVALTVAAIATSAAAQSNRKTTWDDLLKPLNVKTNPAIPVAPPQPAAQSMPQIGYSSTTPPAAPADSLPKISHTPPKTVSTGLLDACIIDATGRLPKADGLQVTNSSYEFDYSYGRYEEVWRVSVSVKLGDRQAQYSWYCHIDTRGTAKLKTTAW